MCTLGTTDDGEGPTDGPGDGVEGLVTVANAALEDGKMFAYESPVSRAQTSQFAVKGREDHAEMSSHPALASLIERYGLVRTYFDQCMIAQRFREENTDHRRQPHVDQGARRVRHARVRRQPRAPAAWSAT